MRLFCSRVLFFLVLIASGAALAQNKPSAPAKPTAAPPPAKQQMQMETAQLVVLIKSTIMALAQANQTGNYSVLRDLGTPLFRERFDQAKLTAVFYNLRQRNIDFAPILFLPPNLTQQPEMKEGNVLHLVGDFPTQPLKIQYEFMFVQVDGVWRIDGLAVDAVPAQATASAAPAPSPAPAAAPAPQQQFASPKPPKDRK